MTNCTGVARATSIAACMWNDHPTNVDTICAIKGKVNAIDISSVRDSRSNLAAC